MKRLDDCSGAAAIEFAIVAPVFLIGLLSVVVAGFMMLAQASLQYATEAAARCASVNKTTCGTSAQIQSYARASAAGIATTPNIFTHAVTSCGNEVSATYPLASYMPFLGLGRITLKARACFPLPPT